MLCTTALVDGALNRKAKDYVRPRRRHQECVSSAGAGLCKRAGTCAHYSLDGLVSLSALSADRTRRWRMCKASASSWSRLASLLVNFSRLTVERDY